MLIEPSFELGSESCTVEFGIHAKIIIWGLCLQQGKFSWSATRDLDTRQIDGSLYTGALQKSLYISLALWLVNLAGRILLYGPLKFKAVSVAKMFLDYH